MLTCQISQTTQDYKDEILPALGYCIIVFQQNDFEGLISRELPSWSDLININ